MSRVNAAPSQMYGIEGGLVPWVATGEGQSLVRRGTVDCELKIDQAADVSAGLACGYHKK
ncbi:MAG TPA: hypothetical protein VEI26_03075 [Terriglobales bacterium]|nr:hypothetical protein [Terriglobales bacterium]